MIDRVEHIMSEASVQQFEEKKNDREWRYTSSSVQQFEKKW